MTYWLQGALNKYSCLQIGSVEGEDGSEGLHEDHDRGAKCGVRPGGRGGAGLARGLGRSAIRPRITSPHPASTRMRQCATEDSALPERGARVREGHEGGPALCCVSTLFGDSAGPSRASGPRGYAAAAAVQGGIRVQRRGAWVGRARHCPRAFPWIRAFLASWATDPRATAESGRGAANRAEKA